MIRKLIALTICFFLLISLSGCTEEQSFEEINEEPVGPKTLYVDDGEYNFSKIQKAIDNASIGDTIFVYSGIYLEKVVINKTLTLIGYGDEKPIIFYDRSSSNPVDIVSIIANNCTFSGFEVSASSGYSEVFGIAIYSSNNNITNNSILNTTKGIYIGPDFNNNTIFGNDISFNNYAVYVQDSLRNKIIFNKITFNERGIYFCCGSVSNMVYLNTFKNNNVWHAFDLFFNQWDNDSVGNYWDDYTGIDNNGDGIGDIPYDISKNISQDNFPLMNPIR